MLLPNAVLTNDHKHLTNQIEKLMHELHAEARKAPAIDAIDAAKQPRLAGQPLASGGSLQTAAGLEASAPAVAVRPFAVVDEVSSSSPADEAGLLIGDQLVAFAEVTGQSQNTLPAVAAALQVHWHPICAGNADLNLS